MYGIFTYYIYHTFKPNVGKYTIHGSYGYVILSTLFVFFRFLKTVIEGYRITKEQKKLT